MITVSARSRQLLKRFLAGTFRATRGIHGGRRENSTVILNYHSVHPVHESATKPDDFTKQMEYMAGNFKIISLHDLCEMRASKIDILGKFAMITFDDGYEDNYEYAFPIIKRLGISATVFVTTGFVNGEVDIAARDIIYGGLESLKWDQILEMRAAGVQFGAHTHTHPILTEISLKDAEDEIVRSKDILENKLHEPIRTFAYPLGQRRTFNPSTARILYDHGFELACSTVWGCDNRRTAMFGLHRVRIDSVDTIRDFKEKVEGNWDFVGLVQRLKR